MPHVVRETARCTIDIDTQTGRVFFFQRWFYNWIAPPGQTEWTGREKAAFHRRSDRMIWAVWSNRAALRVSGTSPFAKRLAGRDLPMNLDVRWVTAKPHWNVFVRKVPVGFMEHPSRIEWLRREVYLCTEDFQTDRHAGGIIAHEFGHAAGNTYALGRGDEYRTGRDSGSVMHTGDELRRRHFRTIIEDLNRMIPGATFSVKAPMS